MKTALIIGASSGIGLELTRKLAAQGFRLGIAARRKNLLDETAAALPQVACVRALDLTQPDGARKIFAEMLAELGNVDFIYLNAGTGYQNPDLRWDWEDETIRVNVLGFAALATVAWEFCVKQGHGHIIGISSVAAVRGSRLAPAYGASKAFDSNLLEAFRFRAVKSKLPIYVTEIRPGFVNTAMAKADKRFWVAPVDVAVRQIIVSVEKRKSLAYVTRRWRLIAWLMRWMPGCLLARLA